MRLYISFEKKKLKFILYKIYFIYICDFFQKLTFHIMDGYKSLLDFVEIEEETTCENCKRKCARKSDMAKHECG